METEMKKERKVCNLCQGNRTVEKKEDEYTNASESVVCPQCKGSGELEVLKKKKFYTAFVLYAQDSVTHQTLQLHCTHKYLGEQNENSIGAVFRIINKFFEKEQKWPLAVFNERVWFHEGKEYKFQPDVKGETISVLKSYIKPEAFFPHLRAELDQFKPDDFPEYNPHITVQGYPSISGHFQCYAIMCGEQVMCWWRNKEWEKMEKAAQRKEQQVLQDINEVQENVVRKKSHLKLMG